MPMPAPATLTATGLTALVGAQTLFHLAGQRGLNIPDPLPVAGAAVLLAGVGIAVLAERRRHRHRAERAAGPEAGGPFRIPAGLDRILFTAAATILLCLALHWRRSDGVSGLSDLALWALAVAVWGAAFIPWPDRRRLRRQLRTRLQPSAALSAARRLRSVLRVLLPPALILALYFVAVAGHADSWRYALIGDEYPSYQAARHYRHHGVDNPFSQDGVYGHHPVMSAVYMAGGMLLFGDDHFGWKMSVSLTAGLTIAGVWALGRLLYGARAGVAAAALLAGSHYLFGRALVGYQHPGRPAVRSLGGVLSRPGVPQPADGLAVRGRRLRRAGFLRQLRRPHRRARLSADRAVASAAAAVALPVAGPDRRPAGHLADSGADSGRRSGGTAPARHRADAGAGGRRLRPGHIRPGPRAAGRQPGRERSRLLA